MKRMHSDGYRTLSGGWRSGHTEQLPALPGDYAASVLNVPRERVGAVRQIPRVPRRNRPSAAERLAVYLLACLIGGAFWGGLIVLAVAVLS